jgi:DtxR family Mn-dependent transcriptional regulator
MHPNDTAIISRVHPESDDLLAYLADLDLMIGCRVTLLDIVPFGGPLVLQVKGEQRYMGREAAERVYIQHTEAAQ